MGQGTIAFFKKMYFILLIFEVEEEGERNTYEREKHQSASLMHPDRGSSTQPGYVP